MDNTEVNISQEIPAYERRYRKISEWFLNCKPAYAILKFIYKYMAYFIAFAYIFLIIMSLRGTFFSETTPIMLRNSGIVVETDKFLLTSKLILTPLTSFILVSVIRKCIDAKRPYEKYNIKPLFVKDTKGDVLALCFCSCGDYYAFACSNYVSKQSACRSTFCKRCCCWIRSRNYMWNCRLMDYLKIFKIFLKNI